MMLIHTICLLLFTLSLALSAKDDTSKVDAIVDWVVDNGGVFNQKQEFRRGIVGDDSTPFGIYAKSKISKGELLVSVPWKCILTADEPADDHDFLFCEPTFFLLEQMKLGDDSFFAPYVNYLKSFPQGFLPSAWSYAGQRLLIEVTGYGYIPPEDPAAWGEDWEECEGDSEDPLELHAAMLFLARSDEQILVPVYDMYNHRNGPRWHNTRIELVQGEKQEVYATRDIQAGEQIYNSYNLCTTCLKSDLTDYGTADFVRDYGFVEDYRQRWIFHKQGLRFDLDEKEVGSGELEVIWLNNIEEWDDDRKENATDFMEDQIYRQKDVIAPYLTFIEKKMQQGGDPESMDVIHLVPKQHEFDMVKKYHQALIVAMESALDSIESMETKKEIKSEL